MSELFATAKTILALPMVKSGLRAVFILAAGLLLSRILTRRLRRRQLEPQAQLLLRQILRYGLLIVTLVLALRELGIDLGVLVGAAGILTVAIGFASQTSASNLISGFFLMGERPFLVGDVVRIGDVLGEVLSIGSLSVTLRTFDNLSVRIPNETVLKSNLINLTRFPIRRYDLSIGVHYRSNLRQVKEVLLSVADKNPLCLEEPKPSVLFMGFGDSSIDFQYQVWSTRESFLELRNSIAVEVKEAFDAAGIEIPFPQRTLTMVSEAPDQRSRPDAEDDAGQQ